MPVLPYFGFTQSEYRESDNVYIDWIKSGSQRRLIDTITLKGTLIGVWVTDTDWSGFVVKDIILDTVTGNVNAWNRVSHDPIDSTEYFNEVNEWLMSKL